MSTPWQHRFAQRTQRMTSSAIRELLASFDVELPVSSRSAFWGIVGRRTLLRLRGTGFRELS